ncbi:unnamed protein product [Schistocephalus solidus]|uniref:Uncharacterized protein n=1 Tax=Schistocephalus solidus TaxID=70667 RepID=A0A183T0P8_SCHSO|nr:unnamed protein product [Schistocephalus solidus]
MLGSRIHEHKLDVRRGDGLSQVAAHTYETGHDFNFAATRIIAHARCKATRELIEAWASDENSDDDDDDDEGDDYDDDNDDDDEEEEEEEDDGDEDD